ncbi:hypothetical protein HK099_003189 [Clydaea vesicula]|uniref:Uncharacterized protein n=1 Tax=Clydaea vesicula TaxID=447962 RepID=A0AAD5XWD8_9FUNG|nr:hypothetical protein HK099_003189 [Clydaea vesicula]KAJ3395950.1 hypothetical protein HDU92_004447 [Lobulomyces angularis]
MPDANMKSNATAASAKKEKPEIVHWIPHIVCVILITLAIVLPLVLLGGKISPQVSSHSHPTESIATTSSIIAAPTTTILPPSESGVPVVETPSEALPTEDATRTRRTKTPKPERT